MKVIGITQVEGAYPTDGYVCIVSHSELERLLNKSRWRSDKDTLKTLTVGQTMDLGEGYSFRDEITEATKKMTEAYEKFAKVAPIAAEFAGIVAAKAEAEQAA